MCTSSRRPDSQAGHATGGQQKATRCTSAAPCPRTLGSLALMATAKVSCILVLRWVPFERRLVDDQEVFYGRRLFSAHARGRQAALTIQRQRLDQQVCLLTLGASVRGGGGSRKGNSHTADTMVSPFLRHRQRKSRSRRCEVLNSAEGPSFRRSPSRRHSGWNTVCYRIRYRLLFFLYRKYIFGISHVYRIAIS